MQRFKRETSPPTLAGTLEAHRAFSEAESESAVEKIATARKVMETQSQVFIDEQAKAQAIAEAQIILAEAGVV